MEQLRFRVFGPTEVRVDGVVVPLRAKRLRALLTALLVEANRVVAPEELIDTLWAGDPPSGPERALHTAVSRLRGSLGPAADLIKTVPGGYLIEVADEQFDLAEFRALVEQAKGVDDLRDRVRLLTRALDLWRDVPLAGGSAAESIQGRPWLLLDRLRAMEKLHEVRLALGEHTAVIPELTVLVKEHPLRERIWIHLMLALYRSGRQAEALAAYRELAAVLAEELGVEPATEVRALHQAILRGEVPAGQVAPAAPADDGWRTHWQLPMDLSDFVGREQVVDEITTRLVNDSAMPVAVVSGPPGVGKSALSVHIGHRLRAQFPDGQWHVRLAGAHASPREPLDVLAELLGLAGLEPQAIPEDLDPRAALLRSTLADRRVLLVLDDARDARQVLPLLPGTAGNAVLITSRNELTALAVSVGARGTRLAMLDPAEATALLSGMLGAERVTAEPTAVEDLAEICGRLPLALRIAAGLLKGHPDKAIAEYGEELRTGDRLEGLAIGDEPDTAVAAAFALSYDALKPPVRRLFALLGVIPGGDFTAPAAAALLDCSTREAGGLLDSLVSVNLVQRERGRYRMHDLIRLYAAGRAEVEPEAGPAWQRLIRWYLRTADAAVDFALSGPRPADRAALRREPVRRRDPGRQLARSRGTQPDRRRRTRRRARPLRVRLATGRRTAAVLRPPASDRSLAALRGGGSPSRGSGRRSGRSGRDASQPRRAELLHRLSREGDRGVHRRLAVLRRGRLRDGRGSLGVQHRDGEPGDGPAGWSRLPSLARHRDLPGAAGHRPARPRAAFAQRRLPQSRPSSTTRCRPRTSRGRSARTRSSSRSR